MKVTNHRTKDGEDPAPATTYEMTPAKAYEQFAFYELGYGGSVTGVTDKSITVRTEVLGCIDYAEFFGTPEELKYFYELAYVDCMIKSDNEVTQSLAGAAFDQLERMQGFNKVGVSPMLLKMGGGIVMGAISVKVSMIQAHGLQALSDLPLRELVDVMMTIMDGSVRDEVIAAYTPAKKEEGPK